MISVIMNFKCHGTYEYQGCKAGKALALPDFSSLTKILINVMYC